MPSWPSHTEPTRVRCGDMLCRAPSSARINQPPPTVARIELTGPSCGPSMDGPMNARLSRRSMLKGSVSAAALRFAQYPLSLFGGPVMDEGVLIPFLDVQPTTRKSTKWQDLTDWITKNENHYVVSRYGQPKLDESTHTLEISGLVRKPRTLTLAEIKKRKRKTVTATLECGG